MAATATANTNAPMRLYPQISPEVRQRLLTERMRLISDPEGSKPPAELTVEARFLFRSYPGTVRGVSHNLDLPPVDTEAKHYKHVRRRWEDRMAKQHAEKGETREQTVKRMEQYYQDLTSVNHLDRTMIVFTPVKRAQECFFATDDPMVAAYIRDLIARKVGEFAQVYEQNTRARVVVGNEAFPDTDAGWRLARQHAALTGQTDIKLVTGDEEGAE